MSCDEVSTFIEAMAVGDAAPDAIRAHVDGCVTCRGRLALAQRIDRILASRPVPIVPPGFTTSVMARMRRERWRAEQVVDAGFNIAIIAGVLFIAAGIGGLAWRSGVLEIGGDMATALATAARPLAARIVTDARVVMISLLLLSTAFALWWWAEEDARI